MEHNDKNEEEVDAGFYTRMTAAVVSAYVEYNPVPVSDLPKLIADVHEALDKLDGNANAVEEEKHKPAVNPKRSVEPDHIVCLECGGRFKSLKRHIGTFHNLSPEEYRAKWKLAADYPMVAPEYAEKRSKLAKSMGLGRKPGQKATKK